MMSVVRLARSATTWLGADTTALYQIVSAASIASAIREQGLAPLCARLREIVPDLSNQYTGTFDAKEYQRYWEIKMRGLHAFQVRCILDCLEMIDGHDMVLADIGDSSGTHGAYLDALDEKGRVARTVSVNLDPVAVEKVRARGGDAVLGRAEELDVKGLEADMFVSFETVEHLTDPVRFLHRLATGRGAKYLLMTVPYRRHSRFGGEMLRIGEHRMPSRMTAEDVHIFELAPSDWRLLARFAGFSVEFSRIYLQYPRWRPLRLTQPLWRRLDFEGFLALFLKRDLTIAERYTDW